MLSPTFGVQEEFLDSLVQLNFSSSYFNLSCYKKAYLKHYWKTFSLYRSLAAVSVFPQTCKQMMSVLHLECNWIYMSVFHGQISPKCEFRMWTTNIPKLTKIWRSIQLRVKEHQVCPQNLHESTDIKFFSP